MILFPATANNDHNEHIILYTGIILTQQSKIKHPTVLSFRYFYLSNNNINMFLQFFTMLGAFLFD